MVSKTLKYCRIVKSVTEKCTNSLYPKIGRENVSDPGKNMPHRV